MGFPKTLRAAERRNSPEVIPSTFSVVLHRSGQILLERKPPDRGFGIEARSSLFEGGVQ